MVRRTARTGSVAATITTAVASVESSSTTTATATRYALGESPAFPGTSLPESTAATLQSLVDDAVAQWTFEGVTAAVVIADQGSWTGTSSNWDGVPMTPYTRYPTHSCAKTFVAAEIMRLVEDGEIGLDDPAANHLPPELAFFDANGATIREVLGMCSGPPQSASNWGAAQLMLARRYTIRLALNAAARNPDLTADGVLAQADGSAEEAQS